MTEPSADTRLRDAIAAVIRDDSGHAQVSAVVDALLPLVVAEVRSAAATAWATGRDSVSVHGVTDDTTGDQVWELRAPANPYRVEEAPPAVPTPPPHSDDQFPLIIPGTQLTTLQIYRLDAACAPLWSAFVGATYIVGSALTKPTPRDLDVRTMLDDEEFDRIFGGHPKLWELVCSSIGERLAAATGLPIDYQIQRTTEANAKYDGPRNPVGMGRVYAGGGDATNFADDEPAARVDEPATPPAAAEIACECCGKRMLGYYLEDDAQLCVQCGDVTAGEGSSS